MPTVDAFIEAVEKSDAAALLSLIAYTPVPCTTGTDRYFPVCLPGSPDGTPVDAFLQGRCDSSWASRAADLRPLLDRFVPGGGPAVLEPFLWSRSAALRNATGGSLDTAAGAITVRATTGTIGEVTVELDPATLLPRRLTRADGLSMAFSGWGRGPSVAKPSGNVPDRGPGGIPC